MKKLLIALGVVAGAGLTGGAYVYNATHAPVCLGAPVWMQITCASNHLVAKQAGLVK